MTTAIIGVGCKQFFIMLDTVAFSSVFFFDVNCVNDKTASILI